MLAQATGERLVSMAEALSHDDCHYALQPDERMGFLFPVHGWRPPRLVREFVGKLTIDGAEGHFCYVLATAGDDIGETMDIFGRDLMAAIGISPQSRYSLLMPNTYVGLPFMDVDDEELAQLKKSKAAHRMATITGEIVERQTGIESINPSRWPRINSRLLGKAFTRWLITDERFRVDDTRCRQCGLCRQVCPVGNISGGKGEHPQWLHTGRCLTCFACYHHCPAHAIDWGRETRGKGQYHYCDKEELKET